MDKVMIPKIVHYCWFGKNSKSGLINECIDSWSKYLPDYKIIEWNESNFDIHCCNYVEEAYKCKKWAFVSDYARLWALYNYGGIYFDTDVQVLKSFDLFLENEAFTGYEVNDSPITAVLGAQKNNLMIKNLLDYYIDRHFVQEDGSFDETTNTAVITKQLIAQGMKPDGRLQIINGFKIYPQVFFCPNNISRIWNSPSSKSFAIHHFDQSWREQSANHTTLHGRIKRYLVGRVRNLIGTNNFLKFAKALRRY